MQRYKLKMGYPDFTLKNQMPQYNGFVSDKKHTRPTATAYTLYEAELQEMLRRCLGQNSKPQAKGDFRSCQELKGFNFLSMKRLP